METGMINRRQAAAGLGAALLSTPGGARAQPLKAFVGYPTSSDFLPAIVAKEFGHFEKAGLDASLKLVPLINNIPAAMMAGDLQIGAATPPTYLQAVDGGLDLVLIASAVRHQKDAPSKSLIVRKNLRYTGPADLKGKKVGIAGFRSAMDILLKRWLKIKGVDPKDITFIEAQFPQMPDLLRNNTLDAVTATEPIRSIILKSGVGVIAAEYYADVSPDFMVTNWMMRRGFAEQNPGAVKAFRDGLEAGIAQIKREPDAMREIEKKNFGVTAPEFPTFSVKATPEDLQLWIDIGKEQGLYRSDMDARKLVWNG
jgi:NitT/TauT family transport system substrate-binding protein